MFHRKLEDELMSQLTFVYAIMDISIKKSIRKVLVFVQCKRIFIFERTLNVICIYGLREINMKEWLLKLFMLIRTIITMLKNKKR